MKSWRADKDAGSGVVGGDTLAPNKSGCSDERPPTVRRTEGPRWPTKGPFSRVQVNLIEFEKDGSEGYIFPRLQSSAYFILPARVGTLYNRPCTARV